MLRDTQSLVNFLGINNLLGDRELEVFREGRSAGRFLRNAVNVDLTDNGTLKRRPGYEQVLSLSGATHIWSDGDVCFVTAEGTLYSFDGAGVQPVSLVSHAQPTFCSTPLGIAFSDRTALRLLVAGGSVMMALPLPSPVPSVTVTSGSLPAGDYIVTFAQASNTLLSGCTETQQFSLGDNSGLSFSLPASAFATIVYVSHQNGEVPYRRLVIPPGDTSASFTSDSQAFEPASTLHQLPLPAGRYMTMHGSRLCSAVSNVLYYSEPFKYGIRKRTGYIAFEDEITGVVSLGNFLYVGTNRELVRLSASDLESAEYESLVSQGVIHGSMEVMPTGEQAFFALQNRHVGAVRDNGEFRMLNEAVRLPPAESASTVMTERDGLEQYTLQLEKPGTSTAQASSYIEAEVVRQENLVNQDLIGG